MSELVEKIKEEIERLYKHYLDAQEFDSGYNMALDDILHFIDSLPEETASEDLEEEVSQYIKENKCYETDDVETDIIAQYLIEKAFKAGAEWQKEKHNKQFGFLNLKDCKDAYIEWKSTQDTPSAALAWMRACEWQKQQMMKDACDTKITTDKGSIFPIIKYQLPLTYDCKIGDKVKIIIIKEE